jgi:stage II sporulation protein D
VPWSSALERVAPAPAVRVGIVTESLRVSLGAAQGVEVFALDGLGAWSGSRVSLTRATFAPAGNGQAAAAGTRYRVQVASLSDEAAARDLAARARAAAGLAASVNWNATTRTYQTRVGDFASREDATRLAGRLVQSGFPGAFAAEEVATAAGTPVRLLETGELLARALVLPSPGADSVQVEAALYRGAVEVRGDEKGTLTVVNLVNTEDYLRGVVPNELSPQAFPQIEALKAQAVAARTYVIRNLGQFAARGYDICATPSCQVYRGRSTEDPLSDRAVAETRGKVVAYRGSPINALYTSTCGGHTEDGVNIFEGEATPYLRGVACEPERSAWVTLHAGVPAKGAGSELARDASLLAALEIGERHAQGKVVPADAEIRSTVKGMLTALSRKACTPSVDGALARRGTLFRYLVGSLCWEERALRLLAPGDTEYLLQVVDRSRLGDEGERRAAAILIQEGVLSPDAENRLRPDDAATRGELAALLARVLDQVGAPALFSAEFQGVTDGVLRVRRAESEETFPLAPDLRLYRDLEGVRAPAREIGLALGDDVRFALHDGRVAFLEVVQTRLGGAADHTSRYYRWETRLTPVEVEHAIARYGSVGHVRDVVPRRIGVSGRVIELSVRGDQGELLLKGLRVRWGLGLRENLFVIEREHDSHGVSRFVFAGKGWGHGVGLCQVGAFGMARSGATFEQILQHYYSDVSLIRAY